MVISEYIVAAGLGWASAQFVKYLVGAIKAKRFVDASSVLRSGSMPSVHTATIVALTIIIGLNEGVRSGIFALSLLMTAIVAYDAMGVRRTAGEQGLILRRLLKAKDKKPYLALGHKPLEVAVGAIIGISAGIIVAFFTANT